MEDDLSEKQAYLRENILEKGYDAEEFMKHLQNKKGESSLDLSLWNLDELKEAVNEFTKGNKMKIIIPMKMKIVKKIIKKKRTRCSI